MNAVRAGVDYQGLVKGVLARFGATEGTLARAAPELDSIASAIGGSEPEGLLPSGARPPSLGEVVLAQTHAATTDAILASRSVSAQEHARLFSLVVINLYLANHVVGDTDLAYRSYRQWLALRDLDGEPSVLWTELYRWQLPAWRAHLRSASVSEATHETRSATGSSVESVTWLVQRIVEEAHLHGVRIDTGFVDWLKGDHEVPSGFFQRAATQRRFNTAVILAQHATHRSHNEGLPRATWTELGPHPPVAWAGHWLNVTNATPTSCVAAVVAEAYDTLSPLGLTRPRGASKRPNSWPQFLDHYLSWE
jgi:hypothetical protein